MALSEIAKSGQFEQEIANVKHNTYNLSRAWYGTGTTGAKIPFDVVELIPNSTYEFNYDVIIRNRYPLQKPLRNNVRAYVETYICKLSDLWEDGENFVDKGIRRDKELKVPLFLSRRRTDRTDPFGTASQASSQVYAGICHVTPNSPLNYMGYPWQIADLNPIHYPNVDPIPMDRRLVWDSVGIRNLPTGEKYIQNTENDITTLANFAKAKQDEEPINALPLVMYEKINIKESDQNLLINNANIFPDHMENLRVPSNFATKQNRDNVSGQGYIDILSPYGDVLATKEQAQMWIPKDAPLANDHYRGSVFETLYADTDTAKGFFGHLNTLRFAYFPDDYFTTSNRWADLIRRGDNLPSISEGAIEKLFSTDGVEGYFTSRPVVLGADAEGGDNFKLGIAKVNSSTGTVDLQGSKVITNELIRQTKSEGIKAKELRKLMAQTVMLEAIGTVNRTDFYNGFMQAVYGSNPKSNDYMPVRIGGFYGDMLNSVVLNQTADTSNPNALGETGANCKIAMSGNTGKVYINDFGYAMSILKIIPNVIYQKSIERLWTRQENADFFNPALEGTEPECIFNYEVSNMSINRNDIFGYVKRNEQYKTRRNVVTGIAQGEITTRGEERVKVLEDLYYIKRTYWKAGDTASTRKDKPLLNNYFKTCCPDTLKADAFVQLEDEWDIMIGCNVKANLPIGEEKPATFGMGN